MVPSCVMHTLHQWCGSGYALRILPGSVGVACSPMLPVSCGGIGCEPVSSICHSSSWWGCEYSTFCWQNYAVNFCSKLLYLSYATDWPGVSVGHPAGAPAIFVDGFFDMVDLRFCVTFCPGEFYFPMCYTHTSLTPIVRRGKNNTFLG